MNKIKWPSKPIVKLVKPFKDKRGFIQPLCDLNMKSASLIFSKKNTYRANHYHKTDWHYIFVISGEFTYYYRNTNKKNNKNSKKNKISVKKNQLLFTPPLVDHCMHYTKDTSILVVSKNPRDQKSYEKDTVRIDFVDSTNL